MPKTLCLLRHAKSALDEPGVTDRERGLNRRGRRAAPGMGRALAARPLPAAIVASPARRAQLTLEGLLDGWPALSGVPRETGEDLYTFYADELLDCVQQIPDELGRVLLIGHNPAMTELVNELSPQARLDNLPTAGYVELVLHVDRWREVMHGCADVAFCLFPRDLPEA